jgi:hypothetical protein
MIEAYLAEGLEEESVFSLFVRRLPRRRNYLVACGLEVALSLLEGLRFSEADLAYLASLSLFSDRLLGWLRDFQFTGDVHAVPETQGAEASSSRPARRSSPVRSRCSGASWTGERKAISSRATTRCIPVGGFCPVSWLRVAGSLPRRRWSRSGRSHAPSETVCRSASSPWSPPFLPIPSR